MATPISSPIVSAYSSREPYLTSAEYLASPTGVDVTQLVPGGSVTLNADALSQVIARASSMIDETCRQVVAATLDIQAGVYPIQRGGIIKIALDRTPILQVTDIAVAATNTPNVRTSLTDLSGVLFKRKTIEIPIFGTGLSAGADWSVDDVYAVVQYVNGYANSLLTAAAAAGANSFTVDNALGILPGVGLTFYDPGYTEQLIVQTVTGNTFTTTTAAKYAHGIGVAASALPSSIKQACVLYTTGLIKTRTDDAFVMPALGAQPSQTTKPSVARGGPEFAAADMLLANHIRVV